MPVATVSQLSQLDRYSKFFLALLKMHTYGVCQNLFGLDVQTFYDLALGKRSLAMARAAALNPHLITPGSLPLLLCMHTCNQQEC